MYIGSYRRKIRESVDGYRESMHAPQRRRWTACRQSGRRARAGGSELDVERALQLDEDDLVVSDAR